VLEQVQGLAKANKTGRVAMLEKMGDLIGQNQLGREAAFNHLRSREKRREENTANMAEEVSNLKV